MHSPMPIRPDKDWRTLVAGRVLAIIHQANGGEHPANPTQWIRVARRLGLRVHLIRRQTSFAAALVDDLIFAKAVADPILCRYLAHEITEAILRRDCGEPLYLAPNSDRSELHRIARMVEQGPTSS